MTPEEDPREDDDWENLEVDGSQLEWDETFEPQILGLKVGEDDTALDLDFLKEDTDVVEEEDLDDLDDSSRKPRRRRRSIFDEDEEADWSWRP